uniref:RxLR effector candidate protein n=1 Tax=Hyaloperonospora arabidopsidis (strain Emoy2) TaxID=559515 RepID=M4BT21_HYAAE
MGLLRHRVSLVILLDKAQNINQQLRLRLPTVCRGWIPAPPDEVTRPTSLHITVVQQAFHEEALATARIDLWMRRRRKHVLRRVCSQSDTVSQLERVTCELREKLEHERSRRLGLVDNVTRLSSERERDRSDFAFAQLENERTQRSLRAELVEGCQDISRLRGEISGLQTRADSQHGEHKYLLGMIERKRFLPRKKSLTSDTA